MPTKITNFERTSLRYLSMTTFMGFMAVVHLVSSGLQLDLAEILLN